MRKIFCGFLILLTLTACSQEMEMDDIEEVVFLTQDVVIPSNIFTSEKRDSIIAEDEIKQSIKIYLDSNEELSIASEPFLEKLYDDQELDEIELEKFNKINNMMKENDKNFSDYIFNNTLPEGYQEETERISRYITSLNETLDEVDKMFDVVDKEEGLKSIKSIVNKLGVVNGKEQKKIEEFLDKKNIDTKAFE